METWLIILIAAATGVAGIIFGFVLSALISPSCSEHKKTGGCTTCN